MYKLKYETCSNLEKTVFNCIRPSLQKTKVVARVDERRLHWISRQVVFEGCTT